jgi:hypothetical protein
MTIRVGVDVLMFLIFLMTVLLWLGSCFLTFGSLESGLFVGWFQGYVYVVLGTIQILYEFCLCYSLLRTWFI